jgi:DNA ligase (NAD+)
MDKKLDGLTFVVTGILEGFSRISIGEFIESHGGKMSETVNAKTSFLVVGDKPGESKLRKSVDFEVKVIELKTLLGMVNGYSIANEIPGIVTLEK